MAAGGFIFMSMSEKLKRFSLAISISAGFVGFLIFTISNSLILSGIGVILVGISVSMTMVSTMSSVGQFTSPKQVPFSTSVVMTVANIGTLLSPYIAQVLSKLSGNNSSEFTFICGAVIMLVLLFLVVWIGINYHKLQYQMNK